MMTKQRRGQSVRALRDQTIGLIGAGKMGQALIKGLLAQGLPARALRAADSSAAIRRDVSRRFRIAVTDRNSEVVRRSTIVILAVKPQQFAEVVAQIAPVLTRRHLVLSIAAGISIRWLKKRLPGVPLVRVMPNLPATVGRGFSTIALGRNATMRHRAIALALFGAVGVAIELPERYFDAVTAVSGSGPAYVFFLVEAWEQAARSLGLPPAIAARAIRTTLKGSVRLLNESGEESSVLISKVASKGGTTEAALKVLAKRRTRDSFIEALRTAAKRSKALARS